MDLKRTRRESYDPAPVMMATLPASRRVGAILSSERTWSARESVD